ncbi:hypothetical protein RHMOL_Rhmol01G0078000 [Rhododendron molle]|uniref:Uncharacterized protein n=1 Tax=Rhododendron molle TaxID=49168 RepID=A0ACC0PZ06_RHOML|nr:hypothetical protein RHMOL_Rhmol01G0078000 [Rhododendron molle]
MGGEEEGRRSREPVPPLAGRRRTQRLRQKLSEIRCLCRCFLVSKRFSSLVARVRTVSINGVFRDSNETERKNPQGQGNGLLRILSRFIIKALKPRRSLHKPALSPPLRFTAPANGFLRVLKQIRSLNVDLASHFNPNKDSAFKWGAKFSAEHDSLTFLYAASLSKVTEPENEIIEVELMRRVFSFSVLWLEILSGFVRGRPMVESITVSDSVNKGVEVCLGGQKLVECREAFNSDRLVSVDGSSLRENVRFGFVPVLQLPVSVYVMKGVAIINFKLYGGDDDSEGDSAMLDAFAEEQGVFSEAIVHILENHKDRINAFF